jgi:hypothetical protein
MEPHILPGVLLSGILWDVNATLCVEVILLRRGFPPVMYHSHSILLHVERKLGCFRSKVEDPLSTCYKIAQ